MLIQAVCDELCQNDKAEKARQLMEAAQHAEAVNMIRIVLLGAGVLIWMFSCDFAHVKPLSNISKFFMRAAALVFIGPVVFAMIVFVTMG